MLVLLQTKLLGQQSTEGEDLQNHLSFAPRKISHPMPIILLGAEHWKKTINFEYLLECGMHRAQDLGGSGSQTLCACANK